MIPAYAVANVVSATGLLLALQPDHLPWQPTAGWSAIFFISQIGGVAHAWLRTSPNCGARAITYTTFDLWRFAFWWSFTAVCSGVGIYLIAPYLSAESDRMLVATFTQGFIAAGVMETITTPLLATIWMGVLIPAAGLTVLRLKSMNHEMMIAFLALYAVVLACGILVISRMFVGRIAAEFAAERERQVVGLLLRDFEAHASDWLWETDRLGCITRAGPRMAEALGLGDKSVAGLFLPSLFARERLLTVPSDRYVGSDVLRDFLDKRIAFSGLIVEAEVNGRVQSWQIAAKPLQPQDGTGEGWRGVGSAVSDSRAREAEAANRERHLYYLATRDLLTALPNRRAFFDRLDALIHGCPSRECGSVAILLIDLDNFKAVNDALGHSVGDVVLRHVGSRLGQAIAHSDFFARIGGDEFAALILKAPTEHTDDFIASRAQQLIEHLREPEVIDHFRIDVRASIGAVYVNDESRSSTELMRKADIALYAAKGAGRDQYKIYADDMGVEAKGRLAIVSDLGRAIERNEMSMVYQCIVDVTTLRVNACEALMRWHHPRYGTISPTEFIPVAEECGLIVPIGLWALEQACMVAALWPKHIRIAVNVSAVQLNNRSFVQAVLERAARAGLEPGRIELEITESSIVNDNVSTRLVLDELRRAGVRIALDDFGTGYSSMVQVRELPIDKLKLDRSFVAGLNGERAEASRSIISSLLHLCSLMNLSVTAEGIETALELDVLRQLGCPSAQGYLFSKPVDATRIDEVIHTHYASLVSFA